LPELDDRARDDVDGVATRNEPSHELAGGEDWPAECV
jgi:hypothetical protein